MVHPPTQGMKASRPSSGPVCACCISAAPQPSVPWLAQNIWPQAGADGPLHQRCRLARTCRPTQPKTPNVPRQLTLCCSLLLLLLLCLSSQVGYFWLTGGLAFAPRNGSALYIDVRLVTHCSEPCRVRNANYTLEGRYGEHVRRCQSCSIGSQGTATQGQHAPHQHIQGCFARWKWLAGTMCAPRGTYCLACNRGGQHALQCIAPILSVALLFSFQVPRCSSSLTQLST